MQKRGNKNSIIKDVKGFSLTELILYLAIIGTLVGVVTGMFVSFNRLRVKAESQTELQQNARTAIERIRQEAVKALSIASPSAGQTAASLQMNMSGGNLTCFQITSGILEMAEGAATCVSYNPITSSKTNIANSDIFTRIDNTGAKPTIQIKLTLTYNNRPEYSYTTQTTVGLR